MPQPQHWWHRLVLGLGDNYTRPLVPPRALLGSLPSTRGTPGHSRGNPPKYHPKWGCHTGGGAEEPPRCSPKGLSQQWGLLPATEAGAREGPQEPPKSTPKTGHPPPSCPQRGLGLNPPPTHTHTRAGAPQSLCQGGWSPLTGVRTGVIWGGHPLEPPQSPGRALSPWQRCRRPHSPPRLGGPQQGRGWGRGWADAPTPRSCRHRAGGDKDNPNLPPTADPRPCGFNVGVWHLPVCPSPFGVQSLTPPHPKFGVMHTNPSLLPPQGTPEMRPQNSGRGSWQENPRALSLHQIRPSEGLRTPHPTADLGPRVLHGVGREELGVPQDHLAGATLGLPLSPPHRGAPKPLRASPSFTKQFQTPSVPFPFTEGSRFPQIPSFLQ